MRLPGDQQAFSRRRGVDMLDNFGFGEFFFLALLALLFFGPERLPQIGAKIGQWIASLTQYSKAFMTEWNEEALAIHDAVQEVKGIRDEIAAAQAEIAGTLHTARSDVGDALSGARGDVQQQIAGVGASVGAAAAPEATVPAPITGPTEQAVERIPGAAAPGEEDAAIAKTQQILDDLAARRARGVATAATADDAPGSLPGDETAASAPTPPSLRTAAHPDDLARLRALRAQVDGLEVSIRALREELAALSALARQQAEAEREEVTQPTGEPA
jgi:sec-independent protein translocase protein TatB